MGRGKVESKCVDFLYSPFDPSTHSGNTRFNMIKRPCFNLPVLTDEDLIKFAWPQDVWFHVDKLSSAHVYLRLPESIPSWESIPEPLLIDCAQLVKANSIEGEHLEVPAIRMRR